MSTTSLFVELLMIGAGAAIWVGLLIVAIFGTEWLPAVAASKELALPLLLPILSITYVLGILVDRLADWFWDGKSDRLRAERFPSREDYRHARTLIYTEAESLRDLYEYGRSRLRICRGWTLNAAFILITFVSFVLSTNGIVSLHQPLLWFGGAASALLGFWSWWAWCRLTRGEYTQLSQQRDFLRATRDSRFDQGARKR